MCDSSRRIAHAKREICEFHSQRGLRTELFLGGEEHVASTTHTARRGQCSRTANRHVQSGRAIGKITQPSPRKIWSIEIESQRNPIQNGIGIPGTQLGPSFRSLDSAISLSTQRAT